MNAAVERLAARGFTPGNTVSPEVTGLPRRTAVVVARPPAARTLRTHSDSPASGTRTVRVTEVAAADRAPVLKAFLSRRALTRSPARSARIYFGLPAHPAVEQLAPLAEHYPVFEISDEPCPPPVDESSRVQAKGPA